MTTDNSTARYSGRLVIQEQPAMIETLRQHAEDSGRSLAAEVVEFLGPVCQRIEVAGSVRRKKTLVHDVDLVAWPMVDDQSYSDLFGHQGRCLCAGLYPGLNHSPGSRFEQE